MGNLGDGSCNSVQKFIVNRIGNEKEHDQRKGDDDQGKAKQRMWGRLRTKTSTIETFLKSLAISINKILYHEKFPIYSQPKTT